MPLLETLLNNHLADNINDRRTLSSVKIAITGIAPQTSDTTQAGALEIRLKFDGRTYSGLLSEMDEVQYWFDSLRACLGNYSNAVGAKSTTEIFVVGTHADDMNGDPSEHGKNTRLCQI